MESQSVNKKRIYREWREGDTGYYKGVKGRISIDNKTNTSFKIDWHSENIPHYASFTLEGKFNKADKEPSLSFLPDEQSMPFDEVEETGAEKLEKTLKNIEAIVESTILVADAIKNASSVFKEGSTRYEKTTYKGQLEGVPNDIVERMMDCQEEQGNKRDASVFEETFSQDKVRGGFDWVDTKEDSNIWGEVEKRNFQPFYDFWKKENKKEKPYIPNCIHTIEWVSESTVKELRKNTITHKINKIETKLSKLNDKREKLLERYKSLGR